LTAEQLEASRAERMRQNGHGAITLEDARVWIEETGLCLFLPRRQFSSSIAPSFVEAVAGRQNATPDPKHIALAEQLLVRLETDGVAVRLNLLGQPGEQPDFVVAAWVLPYVYALRGDRDWRRVPQLTGSRQVSQLAVQAYKHLETGDTTLTALTHALGREVTEGAVLRAITELWQQLRIIPVVSAPGQPAKWQLLRTRFQKAIAEGASTSQVTAISVLASIYLQAVIAAGMEEVELFLAPLTARSKVREVLRGLVATRQVHTITMGHSPQFYVAGTLPEFAPAVTTYSAYTSSSMPASAYFLHSRDHEEEAAHHEAPKIAASAAPTLPPVAPVAKDTRISAETHTPRTPAKRKPAAGGTSAAARPHFSRPAAHSRDRKPVQSSSAGRSSSRPSSRTSSRPVRRTSAETRLSTARPARPSATHKTGSHAGNGSRPSASASWSAKTAKNGNGKQNGVHAANGSGNASSNGTRSNGNHSNGKHSNVNHSNGSAARPSNGATGARTAKSSAAAWSKRNGHSSNGHSNGAKATAKPAASARGANAARNDSALRKETRPDARPSRNGRKPALTAGAKAGNSKRYGFTARPKAKQKPKQETKKRA
jgi:23S rRNA pseudouridine2605 synthase